MQTVVSESMSQARVRTTARGAAARAGTEQRPTEIHVLDNPIQTHDPSLGEGLEQELHRLLDGEGLGRLEVRFRVCRHEGDDLVFICKVEGVPPADPDTHNLQWRWWSPLMQKVEDLRAALRDALETRRQRRLQRVPA